MVKKGNTLLKNLEGVTDRRARFVCCIACVLPDDRSFTVRGEVRGSILQSYRGSGGFGYDPLFWYEPLGRSFAELTPAEKNAVSHRGAALRKFAARLREERFAASGLRRPGFVEKGAQA